MDTVKIKFNYFSEEIGWLGMMANRARLLWDDFFNQAVEEKIAWIFDPKNKKAVAKEKLNPILESEIEEWEEILEEPVVLSFQFPVKNLELLERAANELELSREEFIKTAVFEKIDRVEVKFLETDLDQFYKESDKEKITLTNLEKELGLNVQGKSHKKNKKTNRKTSLSRSKKNCKKNEEFAC